MPGLKVQSASGPGLLRRELAVITASSRQEKPGSAGALRGSPEALRSHLKVPEGGKDPPVWRGGISIRSPAKREAVRLGDPRRREREKGAIGRGKYSPPLSHPTVPVGSAWEAHARRGRGKAEAVAISHGAAVRICRGRRAMQGKVRPTGADPTNQPAASLGQVGEINRAARPGRRPPRHSSRACQSSLVARLATEGAPHSSCWH